MTTALLVAAVILAAYGALAAALWHFQERIVFQPPRVPGGPEVAGATRLSFVSGDGTPMMAYVVGDAASGRAVLAFHGNAVVARLVVPWAREVADRIGGCIVLAEYRGYDGLEGAPTYAGTQLDAAAVLEAASSHLGLPPNDFFIYGHSLGTAVATELGSSGKGRALILQSPFTSARDMVARWPVVGFRVGWSLVSRVHFDTLARVRTLDIPVHVAHGARDMVIPVWMGKAIHAAARVPGKLLVVDRAGHNDVAEVGGKEYWDWVRDILDGG
jgi:fermentation-respiration switch protein FrsA (DUF1100 family)